MTSESVYIILPSTAIGGVEKRLAGLFLHLAEQGDNVRLVASKELLALLRQSQEYASLAHHDARIDAFVGGPDAFNALRVHLRQQVFMRAARAVFHYALASPLRLHASRSRRTLYTIPNASLGQYNKRGLVEVYGGVLRSTRVDVLDPLVFAQLTSRFPWRRESFSLTPGSYVDLDFFRPARATEKRNLILFCGLFSDEKQAPRLVDCIPKLLSLLDTAGFPDTKLIMLGRDPEGGSVSRRVAALRNPRVEARFDPDPRPHLAAAKVFLSLQRSTNHPSKALLEAMACGCAPVVTDTRDSRLSAPDRFASYVPRDFSADDLANASVRLLRRPPAECDTHTTAMRAFLRERFSMTAMAGYYRQLYLALGNESS